MAKQRCTATTAKGQPCQAWSVQGTKVCAAHGGSPNRPGAPPHNTNAQSHGAYSQAPKPVTINDQIADLDQRISRLGTYIDQQEQLAIEDLCKLLDLLSKLMGRVTRMRQARNRMDEDAQSELFDAINDALDEIATERGITL